MLSGVLTADKLCMFRPAVIAARRYSSLPVSTRNKLRSHFYSPLRRSVLLLVVFVYCLDKSGFSIWNRLASNHSRFCPFHVATILPLIVAVSAGPIRSHSSAFSLSYNALYEDSSDLTCFNWAIKSAASFGISTGSASDCM